MILDRRELATVLAALRAWQHLRHRLDADPMLADIATGGGEVEPLGDGEIDDLCERLNTDAEG